MIGILTQTIINFELQNSLQYCIQIFHTLIKCHRKYLLEIILICVLIEELLPRWHEAGTKNFQETPYRKNLHKIKNYIFAFLSSLLTSNYFLELFEIWSNNKDKYIFDITMEYGNLFQSFERGPRLIKSLIIL